MIDYMFIRAVERRLDVPAAIKEQLLRELSSHLAEAREELVETGMNPVQAEIEAEKRLGNVADIAARLNAAHNVASWKSAMLCAVPYIGSAVFLMLPWSIARTVFAALLCLVITVASIRELFLNRRPVWLAPWLAGAFYSLLILVCLALPEKFDNGFVRGQKSILIVAVALVISSLIAGWRVRRWQLHIIAFSLIFFAAAVAAACNFYKGTMDTFFTGSIIVCMLCSIVLLVYFSRCIFEAHPYSNSIQASFFLLAAFTMAENSHHQWQLAASQFLCACTVFWLARAESRKQKISAIWATLFVYGLASPIVKSELASDFLVIMLIGRGLSALTSSAMIYFVVSIPLLMERLARPDRPSIAR